MKITCDVIKDILSLYAEGLVSPDTAALMEEHLAACENCRRQLAELRTPARIPADTNAAPLKKVRHVLKKQRIWTVLCSVLISLVIAISVFGYLTSPEYIRYIRNAVTVIEHDGGIVSVRFDGDVSGYKIISEPTETGDGTIYHITAWDSTWNRMLGRRNSEEIVLNPSGEKVTAVYYFLADKTESILLYGKNVYEAVIILPRLFLAYYLCFALVLAVICSVALLLMRRHKTARKVLRAVLLAPISYGIAHLCVKGVSTMTYSPTRYFFLILLAALLVYGVLAIGWNQMANCIAAKKEK